MARFLRLLVTTSLCVVVMLVSVAWQHSASAQTCVSRGVAGARCSSGENSGGSTYLRGREWQRYDGSIPGYLPGSDGGGSGDLPAGRDPLRPSWIRHMCPDGKIYSDVACPEPGEVTQDPVSYIVTLDDLAQFEPENPSAVSQPAGWTIAGRPTNFIARASSHIVEGQLFGDSAQVRYTPVGYDWDYGDGHTLSVSEQGFAWEAGGLSWFTPTSTSHMFTGTGTRTVVLTARYSAEYRIGSGEWISVSGQVVRDAHPLTLWVVSGRNVLTSQNCSVAGAQRGC